MARQVLPFYVESYCEFICVCITSTRQASKYPPMGGLSTREHMLIALFFFAEHCPHPFPISVPPNHKSRGGESHQSTHTSPNHCRGLASSKEGCA